MNWRDPSGPKRGSTSPLQERAFFESVVNDGWDEASRETVFQRYHALIGRHILYFLSLHNLIRSGAEYRQVRRYVDAPMQGQPPAACNPDLLDLIEDIRLKTFQEIFEGRLLQRFLQAVENNIPAPTFADYLKGVVRNKVHDALGKGRHTVRELLTRLIESKNEDTRRTLMQELKGAYWHEARDFLLCHAPSQQAATDAAACQQPERFCAQLEIHIDAIVHYFFDVYLPQAYRRNSGRWTQGESILLKLLQAFEHDHYRDQTLPEAITTYRSPWPMLGQAASVPISASEAERHPAARLSVHSPSFGLKETLARWWDRLIRCGEASADERRYLQCLALDHPDGSKSIKLCLAIADLKAESGQSTKDGLRMFLAYYLSNYGSRDAGACAPKPRQVADLNLTSVRGQRFSWSELFKLFGRECNPTRVRQLIQQRYELMEATA